MVLDDKLQSYVNEFLNKLQRYVNEFLNKPVESEYYVSKLVESEFGVKFIALLEEHWLVKFLSLNRKFDLNPIKAFYCNLNVTSDGLEYQFHNKLVKFTLKDFDTHFGLWSKENKVFNPKILWLPLEWRLVWGMFLVLWLCWWQVVLVRDEFWV